MSPGKRWAYAVVALCAAWWLLVGVVGEVVSLYYWLCLVGMTGAAVLGVEWAATPRR